MPAGIRLIVCWGLAAITLSGCSAISSVTVGRNGVGIHGHPGPPPHAPAHGHGKHARSHDAKYELVFDSDLGVYVVIDLPDHYYWNGTYLRIEDGHWYASAEIDRGWEPRSDDSLPPGLRMKSPGKGKKTKAYPAKRRGPAKGRW